MKWDRNSHRVTLSTGRVVWLYGGALEIAAGLGADDLTDRSRTTFHERDSVVGLDMLGQPPLDAVERNQIAETMIARWREWGGSGI